MITTNFICNRKVNLSDKTLKIAGSSRDGKVNELGLVKKFYDKIIKLNNKIIMLDVGCNTGSFSLLPTINRNIKCFSFDPNPYVIEILRENIKLNNISENVIPHNNGMWSEKKLLSLKIPLDRRDSGLSTFGENPSRFKYNNKSGEYENYNVECLTLDDFITNNSLKIDAIKIDTEGSELDIIKGGVNVLKEQKPHLLLEYDDKNTLQFNYRRDEIKELLNEIGYVHYEMHGLSDMFAY